MHSNLCYNIDATFYTVQRKGKNMATNSYAQTYLGVLFKISLEDQGYNVSEDGRYIIAEKGTKKFLIQKICRLLCSSGGIDESTVICATAGSIEKLKAKAMQEHYIPAIAFGVCKYEYRTAEIAIIPLEMWESELPFISKTKRGFFFNYRHVEKGGIEKLLLRAVITIQYDNRTIN